MFVLFRTLHFGAISWCTGELFLLTKGTGTFLNQNLVGKSTGVGVVAAYCRKEEKRRGRGSTVGLEGGDGGIRRRMRTCSGLPFGQLSNDVATTVPRSPLHMRSWPQRIFDKFVSRDEFCFPLLNKTPTSTIPLFGLFVESFPNGRTTGDTSI